MAPIAGYVSDLAGWIGIRYVLRMPKPYPAFPYPGGKVNLSPLIVRAFHPAPARLVDVFSGRGNVAWAAMYYRPQQFNSFWMNGVGTAEFLRCFGSFYELKKIFIEAVESFPERLPFKVGSLTPPPTGSEYYKKQKGHHSPGVTRRNAVAYLNHKNSVMMEPYVTFQGGSYAANCAKGSNSSNTAWRGGVSPEGWRKKCELAHQYVHRHRPRITAWDFKKVLARCTSHDMVYL